MPLTVERVGTDAKPNLNLLLYGMPGVGKTTFAAQAQSHPDLAPVLIADLEGGLLSVSSRGDIDAVRVRTTQEMDELFWMLRNGTGDFGKYRTVVIDSGTNLANRALEEWSALNKDRAQKRGRGSEWTIDDIQLEDYGKMLAQIRRLMTWYRDLPLNLIVTALARFEFAQGADKRSAAPVSVGPDFTASVAGAVTGMMDHAWYMYTDENGDRHMLTQERGVYRAKTRGANFARELGYHVADPTLPEIYDLLVRSESAEYQTPSYPETVAEGTE